jgi:hypothetical protein
MHLKHNPRILPLSDGRWVVVCPQCEALSHLQDPPIGIAMPLASRASAEMLRKNHYTAVID